MYSSSFINWKKEIAASFKLYSRRNGEVIRLTNGKIEGKNSYIKKLLRLANGYENFDRFRNRAMYVENLNDKASIEPMSKPVRKNQRKRRKGIIKSQDLNVDNSHHFLASIFSFFV